MANDIQAQTPLFTFDQVKIEIQDLVRTGFMDKYNELAKAVFTDVTWRFDDGTSGGQILEFHTSDQGIIEVPIFGGGFTGELCAEDICYDDALGRYDTVQEALDALLNPYQAPTGTTTGAPGLKEVGDTSFYPVALITTGTRRSKDLEYVKLIDGAGIIGGGTYTSSPNPALPGVPNVSISKSYSTTTTPSISANVPITYSWSGKVKDVDNAERNAGSDSLTYVYPYYKFNSLVRNIDSTSLNSLINTGSISSILNSSGTGPSQIQLDAAATSQFMHVLVPAGYTDVTEIIDANLGLGSAPGWDTTTNPDSSEFTKYSNISLTKTGTGLGPNWTNILYEIYVAKIEKSNLSLIFKK